MAERLDSFYNAVLAQIPANEWLIKIDCNQIYYPGLLKLFLSRDYDPNWVICWGKYNLHYDIKSQHRYNIKKPAISFESDHWLIYNKNLHFIFCSGVKEDNFFAWEYLDISDRIDSGS